MVPAHASHRSSQSHPHDVWRLRWSAQFCRAQRRTISNAACFAERIGGTRNAWRTETADLCAIRVTSTRQHTMIQGEKALILLTFLRQSSKEQIGTNFCAKKPANALALRAFSLVAGVGFEPTTFRL